MPSKTLTYTLVRSSRKSLGITIERNNDIIVRAPQDCSIDVINGFLKLRSSGYIRKWQKNVS
ncbi:hypothetical protein [Methanococcoides seepicolus]|uniref:Uncharacterized protein n=1 Tax=Methanococcoides seepicolus TaxID=2828780 RepID=A0A9E5DAW6_9EURY|nr:hypothetical protein [Methanococcoides seepicolus]MCM1987070.1 hypothetical protein [Methanococcoides seepicolus]